MIAKRDGKTAWELPLYGGEYPYPEKYTLLFSDRAGTVVVNTETGLEGYDTNVEDGMELHGPNSDELDRSSAGERLAMNRLAITSLGSTASADYPVQVRRPLRALLLVACAAASGCAILTNLDGLSGEAGGMSACDGGACAEAQGPTTEAGVDADAGVDATTSEAGCPTGRGPEMVRVRDFCVDSTEVTVGQYRQFLVAMSSLADLGLSTQVAECGWNTTFTPEYWYPTTPKEESLSAAEIDAKPIGVVDWCDARAFCAWSGKRLCGAVGGGSIPLASAPTPAGEWFAACSHNGLNPYPYGEAYFAGSCNDTFSTNDGRAAVKSFAGCVGGYDGLFDMSGNVAEWIDSCAGAGAAAASTTKCAVIGGPWNFNGALVRCDSVQMLERAEVNSQTGIRCCATP